MINCRLCLVVALAWTWSCAASHAHGAEVRGNARPAASEADLRAWLENMIWYHRFSAEEVAQATGLSQGEIDAAIARWQITPSKRPARPADRLLVLPYPGGRHPRIGFLEGAVNPQRETKLSVFCPWDETSYVVADVPEALWSNLGLTYLAHEHVPTLWTMANVQLETLEWRRLDDGSFEMERKLPNGIRFGTRARATKDAVRMEMWLFNGTAEKLSDLRVQNCVMLKGASGFEQQTNDNKVHAKPYTACHDLAGRRWIISAWEPCHRAWSNPPCPCLHSDPKFPDCGPGETQRLRGWLSFYEGTEIEEEFRRIDATGWRTAPLASEGPAR